MCLGQHVSRYVQLEPYSGWIKCSKFRNTLCILTKSASLFLFLKTNLSDHAPFENLAPFPWLSSEIQKEAVIPPQPIWAQQLRSQRRSRLPQQGQAVILLPDAPNCCQRPHCLFSQTPFLAQIRYLTVADPSSGGEHHSCWGFLTLQYQVGNSKLQRDLFQETQVKAMPGSAGSSSRTPLHSTTPWRHLTYHISFLPSLLPLSATAHPCCILDRNSHPGVPMPWL